MTVTISQIRHAELQQLFGYWLAKRGGAIAPPRSAIDPAELRNLLPKLLMIDVIGDPPRFCIRLAGTEVVHHYGAEITGRFIDELDLDEIGEIALKEYRDAVERLQPVLHEWDYTKHDGRHLAYERLILPLSSDGRTVDKLLCGVALNGSYQTRVAP
jgi:hypothetical protein